MARTKNFADVIRAKMTSDPDLARAIAEESFNASIAQQVHDLRVAAKLTQKQLAARIGTQQSVISRIEDADYGGHSLTLLKRIAQALDRQIAVEFKSPRVTGSSRYSRNTPNGPKARKARVERG